MGTKNNPGRFDCYEAADPDEPLFTLRARDPLAPILVETWAYLRKAVEGDSERVVEAESCAEAMREWRSNSNGRDA